MSGRFKVFIACTMSFILTNFAQTALAESSLQSMQMISTQQALLAFNRQATQEKVKKFLNRDDVRKQLVKQGLAPDEALQRVASLNDRELQQLSTQMDAGQYGGDILVTILLVVLIIFLIKRI